MEIWENYIQHLNKDTHGADSEPDEVSPKSFFSSFEPTNHVFLV